MTHLYKDARLIFACLPLVTLILQGCATNRLDATPFVKSYREVVELAPTSEVSGHRRLRVMTLNMAHGRGNGFHQLLQQTADRLAVLDSILGLLQEHAVDIIALQEADAPSFWSGRFNHIDYLANRGDFSHAVQGLHADGLGLAYGTALIANRELRNPKAVTFDPEFSTIPKGFLVSTIRWPGSMDTEVDIVSVHLDFASRSTRRKQAIKLIEILKKRGHPVIIMGDFNAEWSEDSTVKFISRELGLSSYLPEEPGLETFPTFGKRLDWILVSRDISFQSYRVPSAAVSDHRAVIAELELTNAGLQTAKAGASGQRVAR